MSGGKIDSDNQVIDNHKMTDMGISEWSGGSLEEWMSWCDKTGRSGCDGKCERSPKIGRSWWKLLGYNSPCQCAKNRVEFKKNLKKLFVMAKTLETRFNGGWSRADGWRQGEELTKLQRECVSGFNDVFTKLFDLE